MKKIAVTGGMGSGKSIVCQFLKEAGAYVVDADTIVRQYLTPENPIGQQVIKLLGSEVIINNQIDRKKISNIVFSSSTKLKALESILHPAVSDAINQLFETVKENKMYKFFVAEVPLLFEARMEHEFDSVIAVITQEKIARGRAEYPEEFDRRSRFQLPSHAKQAQATYVIKNDGDIPSLKAEVTALIPQLLSNC